MFVHPEGAPQYAIHNGTAVESRYIDRAQVYQTNGTFQLSLYDVQTHDLGYYICVEDANLYPILLTSGEFQIYRAESYICNLSAARQSFFSTAVIHIVASNAM